MLEQERLVESLRNDIRAGRCLVVVGTGVTTGATRAAQASWPGFLASGLARARAQGAVSDADATAIENYIAGGSTDELLMAAAKLVDTMGGTQRGTFGLWLREDIGYLSRSIHDRSVIDAIGALRLPILTTNYDDVLEKVLGRDYSTWKSKEEFQLVARGASDDVLHLHGHWKAPDSIVLTQEQYSAMLADTSVTALRHAMVSLNTMLYVGFGEGLSDPNFKRLRTWTQETLDFQQFRHYRLCRESELGRLRDEHRDELIIPLTYGASHADLAPFLSRLRPDDVGDGSNLPSPFETLEERVRETAVLSPYVRRPDDARISDLLIPPVLLPVPNDQYVSHRDARNARPERCDLNEEVLEKHLLIAGEEHVGVSSALHWLCSEIYLGNNNLVPVTVDYLQLGTGPTPLRKQILKQLRAAGRGVRDDEALPSILLVLDNVNGVDPSKFAKVVAELTDLDFDRVLLGCRTGSETQVADSLAQAGLRFRIRYVGRLGRGDVRELARLVEPSRAVQLTRQAARVAEEHQLPSTPFTMSMILGALLRGESLMAASSPTSLLDAYVEALLGRGTQTDDSRYGFDSGNHAHILSQLASEFVRRRAGSVSEVETVATLTEVLNRYGWPGEASDLLRTYRDRRILVLRNRDVLFTQNSYLYLFAAKHAIDHPDFLAMLTDDPLYFSPIITHYAALRRNDFELVKRLIPQVLDPFAGLPLPTAPALLEAAEPAHEPLSDKQLARHFRKNVGSAPHDDDEDDLSPIGGDRPPPETPFPLQPVDIEPTIPHAIAALSLCSSLLRDTEIVEDQELRRLLFTKTLETYVVLVNLIANDDRTSGSGRAAAEELAQQMGISKKRVAKFIDDVVTLLPLAIAFAGVSTTLSSAKLERLIDACLQDKEFNENAGLSILAFYVLFDVHGRGWTRPLQGLQDRHSKIEAVKTVVSRMTYFAYVRRPQEPADDKALQEFLVNQAIGNEKGAKASRRRGRAMEALREARLLASRDTHTGPDMLDDASDE